MDAEHRVEVDDGLDDGGCCVRFQAKVVSTHLDAPSTNPGPFRIARTRPLSITERRPLHHGRRSRPSNRRFLAERDAHADTAQRRAEQLEDELTAARESLRTSQGHQPMTPGRTDRALRPHRSPRGPTFLMCLADQNAFDQAFLQIQGR